MVLTIMVLTVMMMIMMIMLMMIILVMMMMIMMMMMMMRGRRRGEGKESMQLTRKNLHLLHDRGNHFHL